MFQEDQERYLDEALNIVKSQSFHMNKTIEENQLRQCLKETSAMLSELRTSLLSPRNYYHLYTIVFDQMKYLEQFFKEEYKRGRIIKYLYSAVQQASKIIPRLYLLITVGSVYMETERERGTYLMFDMLQMVKGVQNPLRGLFVRYYLLKMIKDKLPDSENEGTEGESKIDDTITFILQNLEEMNRLWIRLSIGCTGNEKLLREKERNELKVLVGENIIRLASLNGLTLKLYKEEVLERLIAIILETKDQQSQHYLMECIIHAFPDDYNIHCMERILDTCTQLVSTVDVKLLFINLMEKLSKFVGDPDREDEEELPDTEVSAKIFELLTLNIDKIINEFRTGSPDILKLIELQVAFMKFTIKCCPNKLVTVNHILEATVRILDRNKNDIKISLEGIKLIGRLLSAPIESSLSIFQMPEFPSLMNFLDFSSRSQLSLRIIESLVNIANEEKLDSAEKVSHVLSFLRPLITDLEDSIESEAYQFESEQQAVVKFVFIIHNPNPYLQFDILEALKSIFLRGGSKRQFYTLPALVNSYFQLVSAISYNYEVKLNNLDVSNKPVHHDYVHKMNTSFENEEEYVKLVQNIYKTISEILRAITVDHPEISFKLALNSINSLNDIRVERARFEEVCYDVCTTALTIFQDSKITGDRKVALLDQFIASILAINILNEENMLTIITNIQQQSQALVKRTDQCITMLNCSHLYYKIGDVIKVQDCLTKAKRFADFAMTNPQNLNLLVLILNKYVYYIEKGADFIKLDIVNDIIEVIKNHIETINTENINASFMPSIEEYFRITLELIQRRMSSSTNEVYKQIVL